MTATKQQEIPVHLLRAAIARMMPAMDDVGVASQLSGGASQETWSFIAHSQTGAHHMILRRVPPGYVRPHRSAGVAVEAALIEIAGEAGVPVPKVHGVLCEKDGLGEGFVMSHVAGETIPRKLLRDPEYAEVRPRLAFELGKILARIHAINPSQLPPMRTVSAARELEELFDAYLEDGQPRPVFEVAFRWLRSRCASASAAPCLVHGDFRSGNLMITPHGVSAVLDWELAHLGDAREDLGWLCVNSWRFGALDRPAGGFGTREDLLSGYRAGGGAQITVDELKFWEALGTLRWGVICLGMRKLFETGKDCSIERAMIARRASETELDLLRLLAPRSS